MSSLDIRELTVQRGLTVAVDALNLNIRAQSHCVIVGPSGCGKSSLLQAIAGLIPIEKGQIRIDGQDLTRTPARKRNVSILFQHDTMYPHMTVEQTFRAAAKAGSRVGRPSVDFQTQLTHLTQSLDLDPGWLSRRPDSLSGGQRRRVAIAKTLFRNPAICLLDEPLEAIDTMASESLLDWLVSLQAAPNESETLPTKNLPTLVSVTHNGEEAMRLADQIVVMDRGKILQSGTPTEIYDRPNSLAVARAIGSPPINALPLSRLAIAAPELHSRLAGQTPLAPKPEPIALLRPEAIELLAPSDESAPPQPITQDSWQFQAQILRHQWVGSRTLLELHFGPPHARLPLRAVAPSKLKHLVNAGIARSQPLVCRVPISSLHLVPAASSGTMAE